MLRRLLLLVLAATLLTGAACGDDSDDNGNGGPPVTVDGTVVDGDQPTPTPTLPASTTGTVSVDVETATVGDTVTVTASGWTGEGPIQFFLLTPDQAVDPAAGASAVANGEAAALGEATPDGDGNATFEFTLEGTYATDAGEDVVFLIGDQLTVFAFQGSTGTRAAPFTLQ
jgi:hypothetical protein